MRLIDADALKKALKWIEDNPYIDLGREIMQEIDNAPTVETHDTVNMYCDKDTQIIVEQIRPKGEWIICNQDNDGIHKIECPFCKYTKGTEFGDLFTLTFEYLPPYCEKCGADMRKEDNP